MDLLRNLYRVLVHDGPPLQLIYFVTGRCNLRCRHCFYRDHLDRAPDELSLAEIGGVSRSLGRLLWFSMTGGEPFLRDDLADIAALFYANNHARILTVVTNGTLPERILPSVRDLCTRCPEATVIVYVSVDGLEQTHNSLRGTPDGFGRAVDTLQRLVALKPELPNLSVATVTTINHENQAELTDLAALLRDRVQPDTMTINMLRGGPRSGPLGDIDLNQYLAFADAGRRAWTPGQLRSLTHVARQLVRGRELLQKEIIATVVRENRYVLPCLAGRISCVLSETGELYPCETLDTSFGNVRDVGLDVMRLWNSARATGIRRQIKQTRCFCTYECALTTNILFSPWQLLRALCRRRPARVAGAGTVPHGCPSRSATPPSG